MSPTPSVPSLLLSLLTLRTSELSADITFAGLTSLTLLTLVISELETILRRQQAKPFQVKLEPPSSLPPTPAQTRS